MKKFWQVAFVPLYLVTFITPVLVIPNAHLYFLPLLLLALAVTTLLERAIPFMEDWNKSKDDLRRDIAHAVLNHGVALGFLIVTTTIVIRGWIPALSLWPTTWSIPLQLLLSVVLSDGLMTLTHYASHQINWLWRLHSVHHSVERVYALNGLMKHPLHKLIEATAGFVPLYLLGMSPYVALLTGYVSTVVFFLAHMNADIKIGPFGHLFAFAPVHRYHHLRKRQSAVNYGISLMLWDHLLKSFYPQTPENDAELRSLGLKYEGDYPRNFVPQLLIPWRWRWKEFK
jgi:sterol desaturase/sphingolipid hydroxylase (fatty acid hydroxylase superfamily)